MKIVLLPLDERPCNLLYPQLLPVDKEVKIVVPGEELLSHKKDVCDVTKLDEWLLKESFDADYAVISLDTLLFGGIVPSRLHHLSMDEIHSRGNVIREIKKNNPKIKIYCNELIMRCPSYSLSDEEPDYFDECGLEIFKYGVYLDKEERGILEPSEREDFEAIKLKIKPEYLEDFMGRREKNLDAILYNLKLIDDNVVDLFVIPQDDCSPYGFTSRDQKIIKKIINDKVLQDRILMYPGADEVGLTLISRAINDYHNYSPKVYVHYASKKGKNAIPSFEDRPINETISYHLYTSGAIRVYSLSECDIALMVNLGSEFLPVWDGRCELAYEKNRNIISFVQYIQYAVEKGVIVGVGDVAYCNQADKILIDLLAKSDLMFKISGYAGWNTSSNTLGTVISNLLAYYYSKDEKTKNSSLLFRYIEDYLYMGKVRELIIQKTSQYNDPQINRFYLGEKKKELEELCSNLITERLKYLGPVAENHVKSLKTTFVWNRTFEIKLEVEDTF